MTRREILEKAVTLQISIAAARNELQDYRFDTENPFIHIGSEHVRMVMEKYLNGTISNNLVEDWANFIEGRDDIGFTASRQATLSNIIYVLANPVLEGSLDIDLANDIIKRLI